MIAGYVKPAREESKPSKIPIIIGFFAILMAAFLIVSFFEMSEDISLP